MSKVKEVKNSNISDVLTSPMTLIQFSAEWCGPCKILSPIVEEIAKEQSSDVFNICKVNVDDEAELALKYKVRGIPTMIFFKDGVEALRLVGAKSKAELEEHIKSL